VGILSLRYLKGWTCLDQATMREPGYLWCALEGRSKSYGIPYAITPHDQARSDCRIGNRGPLHYVIETFLLVVKAL